MTAVRLLSAAALIAAIALVAVACGSGSGDASRGADGPIRGAQPVDSFDYPPPPAAPGGPAAPRVSRSLEGLVAALTEGRLDRGALAAVTESGDARLAWFISDLLRFVQGGPEEEALVEAFRTLSGVDPSLDPTFSRSPWLSITNHLIAWDLPAAPGYRQIKARLFLQVEPAWAPFFGDEESDIDWRLVSWGGVLIDDRPLGDRRPCSRGCIPALDDPPLVDASAGGWYPDERIVFGVVIGDEAVALPRNVMEVHEMVNITIGGRRLGIPYCTLCGSAQAYLTDAVPPGVATPVLRTSGLLSRSNKVMYDLRTRSVLDTFSGQALSGPLRAKGVRLRQATVVASTWGAWKRAHPRTRIVAEDGGIGREYPADPLRGRDEDGPIFPIGPSDPRLPVQAEVVGVIGPDGPVAFPVQQALKALTAGRTVTAAGVEVRADGDGLRARRTGGGELAAHQAFWFAWSQFHPRTVVWTPVGG